MANDWTPQFEMDYWTAHPDEFYRHRVQIKWDLFGAGGLLGKLQAQRPLRLAVDIGGGKLGGALPLVAYPCDKLLLDALADRFAALGTLPAGIQYATCDFADLPVAALSVDVLFAWNVYDHARNMSHFWFGMREAIRVLRQGGMFLGTFPLRQQACKGHPLCLTEVAVKACLRELTIRRTFIVREPHFTDNVLFVEAVKC
jgi:SAM-dependent methyltransferase